MSALDFGKPVLDFVLVPNEALAWVVLDSTWSAEGEVKKDGENSGRVQLVSVSASGEVSSLPICRAAFACNID